MTAILRFPGSDSNNLKDTNWPQEVGSHHSLVAPKPLLIDIMMRDIHHQDMRTTLTLDHDVALKLRAEARRSGRPFREVVNEMIRRGLMSRPRKSAAGPFRVTARDLGSLRPGYNIDNIGDLLEQAEGPLHR